MVEDNSDGSKGLIAALRRVFMTLGSAEELSSDEGPEFTAGATVTFLHNWGVHHRVSCVAHPHRNGRTELGVKTVKRMLVGSTGAGGSLNTDAFQRPMLVYRNTPDPVSRFSPAEIIFERRIRDFIPAPPGREAPWSSGRTLALDAARPRSIPVGGENY